MSGKSIHVFWVLFGVGLLFGCGGAHPKEELKSDKTVKVILEAHIPDDSWRVSGKLNIPGVFHSVDEVDQRCAAGMEEARAQRNKLVEATADTPHGVLQQMNHLDASLDRFLPHMSLMANVHPDKSVRDAAEKCREDAMALVTELSLDTEIYRVLSSVDADKLSPLGKRSLKKQLKAYRRAGVDRDKQTRKEITDIQQKLVKTVMDFSREIREGTRYVDFSIDELTGLPKDFIEAHKPTEDNKIRISTDYPDFFPVVNYAIREETRKAIYKAFLQRAWPENEKNLETILALRARLARLLGFDSWADYAAEIEMAKNADTIARFIDEVAEIARPRMRRDLDELLERKRKDNPQAETIHVWDRFYYVNRIKAERFELDLEALRQYFPYQQVIDGVLEINELLFGVTFKPAKDAEVWHSDVVAFDVYQDAHLLGRFFLDMHPREGKYKHMAMFHVVEGVRDKQLPAGALVCNFPRPDEKNAALMGHADVVTLFHEFGHLMHHILAGGYPYLNLTGISCESEFVEAPSQLLEEWAFDAEVLAQFARHMDTGEPIPASVVEKLQAAREFGKGIHVMRQMFYAAMSLQFHVVSPDGLNLQELTRQLQREYNPYPYEPETYVFASFGHLTGYTSEYYSYMWSLKLAQDMLTRFRTEGMLNPATAADYREFVIRQGGAIDAEMMVESFLGRKTTFDAFRKYLEE